MVSCFGSTDSGCVIEGGCRLKHVLSDAESKFYGELDNYSLQDLIEGNETALWSSLKVNME
jgi:DNA-binding IscR family transcriptional regulator